ncbi:7757_t:CDS:2 [Funneliformis mosseae]|uniref:Alpha N-terminal protein methyltransferase 1 n=1 Tax=Funneliformis mosseae TaxID=27381 RepID=A0A9N9CNC8_FUNMO|nr:7757_t:CDS:2 [Funneliformis mosseae]
MIEGTSQDIETLEFQKETWYTDALDYWSNKPATINGVLGGYGKVDKIDTEGSRLFISEYIYGKKGARNRKLTLPRITEEYACDCGAGIGRVTKNFLSRLFKKVDLVEYTPKFIERAEKEFLKKEKEEGKIGEFICKGLQEFIPEERKYDLIWCQWVIGHLKDDDLIEFFKRCKIGLKPNGLIGVKENVCVFGYQFDETDSSVTRSDEIFKDIFQKSGLKLIKEATQHGMPKQLYEVKMYALECADDLDQEELMPNE